MLKELRKIRKEVHRLKNEAWNTDLRERMINLEEDIANLIDKEMEKPENVLTKGIKDSIINV